MKGSDGHRESDICMCINTNIRTGLGQEKSKETESESVNTQFGSKTKKCGHTDLN